MPLRPAYLSVTNAFALLRLLTMSDRDKDTEILALRHQITVLERHLGDARLRFSPPTGRSTPHCCTDSRSTRFVDTIRYASGSNWRAIVGEQPVRLPVRPETVLR